MVYRVFVEKKKELAQEAKALLGEARDLLGIKNLTDVRVINRYDAENITPELFDYAKRTVFSEPQLDIVSDSIEINGKCFAVEFLPGQFDQRADSAAQCIQIISQGERPLIRTAKIYILIGDITDADAQRIKKYVINPVEAREASLEKPETLAVKYDIPTEVRTLDGFINLYRAGGLRQKIRSCHGRGRHCVLPGLFQIRAPRPDDNRNSHDRHLLVGSLPSHDILDRH